MKKILSILIAVILAMSCALSVSADVVFEPDDNFYTRNADKCVLVERYFVATKTVYTVNEPNSDITYGKLNKDDEVYISYTYEDKNGIVWGLISFSDVSGWIPMGYLEVVYDNISFTEEFGDKFVEPDSIDELFKANLSNTDPIVFWEYPGSESYWEFEAWQDSYSDIGFLYLFDDASGATWGYVAYYYGASGWVYIDNPSSTEVTTPLERDSQNIYYGSVLDDDSVVEKGGLSTIWIAVTLVCVVCVATGVIILIITKKKKASAKV